MKIKDLGKLFDKNLLVNPVCAMSWETYHDEKGKAFKMLSFHFFRDNYYHTSITPKKWSKMSLTTKADLINYISNKLL